MAVEPPAPQRKRSAAISRKLLRAHGLIGKTSPLPPLRCQPQRSPILNAILLARRLIVQQINAIGKNLTECNVNIQILNPRRLDERTHVLGNEAARFEHPADLLGRSYRIRWKRARIDRHKSLLAYPFPRLPERF